jgi:hypothetical protein
MRKSCAPKSTRPDIPEATRCSFVVVLLLLIGRTAGVLQNAAMPKAAKATARPYQQRYQQQLLRQKEW